MVRHNAAAEGADTSVTPTEDMQLVLDRYSSTFSEDWLVLKVEKFIVVKIKAMVDVM